MILVEYISSSPDSKPGYIHSLVAEDIEVRILTEDTWESVEESKKLFYIENATYTYIFRKKNLTTQEREVLISEVKEYFEGLK